MPAQCPAGWLGDKIRHAMCESSRYSQAGGFHVINHIVIRGMGKHNLRCSRSDHRSDAAQHFHGIDNLKVITQGRMVNRTKDPCRLLRLPAPHPPGFLGIVVQRPAISTGKSHIVQLITGS